MPAVTASPRIKDQHDASPGPNRNRTEGTSCETSKRHPCPNRAHELRDYSGLRIWVCKWCAAALKRGGFFSFEVRRW